MSIFKKIGADANKVDSPVAPLINPFKWSTQYVRKRKDLEKEYEEKRVRNPIGNCPEQLGRFLDMVWTKRDENRGAADYILTTLLLGARRCETSPLMWYDRLGFHERSKFSYVDLNSKTVRFKNTKTGNDHELPLCEFLSTLLAERRSDRGDEIYVFPAKSTNPKTKSEYYNSPREFVYSLRKALDEPFRNAALAEALTLWEFERKSKKVTINGNRAEFIAKWEKKYFPRLHFTMHDLRRTFCTVALNMENIPYAIVRRLMNHSALSDVTARFGKVNVEDLRPYMQQLENELLRFSKKIPRGKVGWLSHLHVLNTPSLRLK